MNALYVTVSIPLLLVLAGFNHAHGLTTFGKPIQGTQQQQKPVGTDFSKYYKENDEVLHEYAIPGSVLLHQPSS
jgi:hypothetical protein